MSPLPIYAKKSISFQSQIRRLVVDVQCDPRNSRKSSQMSNCALVSLQKSFAETDQLQAAERASACWRTNSIAFASRSGGYLYFRNIRLTISRKRALTVSLTAQS